MIRFVDNPMHFGGVRERLLIRVVRDEPWRVAGEIDASNAGLLLAVLDEHSGQDGRIVELDVSAVDFLGAAGVRALIEGTRRFRGSGGKVKLIGQQPGVEHVLRTLQLDRLLHYVPTGSRGG